MKTLVKVYHKP